MPQWRFRPSTAKPVIYGGLRVLTTAVSATTAPIRRITTVSGLTTVLGDVITATSLLSSPQAHF